MTDQARHAVGFRIAGNLANVLFGLGLGVILARLLPPEEFGVFAVGIGIVSMVEIISSGGMLDALVQRKNLLPEDEPTAALLQLGWASVLGTGLLVTGPMIEKFFGFTDLGPLIQLQAVVLITGAFSLIPTSRLMRRLAFDRLAVIDISTRALEGAVSITLALHGYGAFSLAVGSVTGDGCRTLLCWALAPGRFPLSFRWRSAESLVGYGVGILCNRACIAIGRRADILIIGRYLGAELVGLYQRASQLATTPLFQFTNAANEALFPAMSRVQDEDHRFRQGFLGTLGLASMLTFPLLTVLWTAADLFIPLMYGPRWNGAVPILMSLGVVGYIRIVNNPNGMVVNARGHALTAARYQAIVTLLSVSLVFLGTYVGMQGVVIGIGIASSLSLFLMTRFALSISGISFLQWLGSLRSTIFSSAAMALAILGLKALLIGHMPSALILLTVIFCGSVVYITLLRTLLTAQERQLLERIFPVHPVRLRSVFLVCIGSKA